jgi:SAM-dependent methyltransferase
MRMLRCLVSVVAIALTVGAQTADQREAWNKTFGDQKARFNRAPSRLLVVALADRKPGEAIDLGMGEGRNAIFLAQRGWRVTGVDLSDVGVAQAKKRAAELGVPLEAVVEDLDKYDFGRGRWDLITLFYMHAWYHLSKLDSARRLRDALKPGGLLVIEGFAGGEVGYQTNELLGAFNDLKILRYEDVMDEADWAPGEKSHIVRFVGEKPR